MPSPATLRVTVIGMALRSQNPKTRIVHAIRDTLEVIGALEVLIVRVFAFASLVYVLFRMIR
jgi:hypothetical protein